MIHLEYKKLHWYHRKKIYNTYTQPEKLTILTVESIDFEEASIHEEKQTDGKTNLEDRKEFNFSKKKHRLRG